MMKVNFLLLISLVVLASCQHTQSQTDRDLSTRIAWLQSIPQAAPLGDRLQERLLEGEPGPNGETYTKPQREALRFLYAYMPLNDLAEHPLEYYEGVVVEALKTKEMPWGRSVPDELFNHYVLPPRVNNEYLDGARTFFYEALAPRVKGKSMYDAVIEVNHWCREKIVYQPTDGRTTPPYQTAARGYGRCGEESVVGVAALRSIGIPARQVYVPRWAHTDDNHAWVEVWVDGQWYYLGACEPEPVLNRGWFTGAASRAMLVNTYAFGPLDSQSKDNQGEVISTNASFTEVSNVANYAPVKQAVVKVTDAYGAPFEGANVAFCLYNYAEFYPLAIRATQADGLAVLTTGLGTLLVEVSGTKGNDSFYAALPYPVAQTDTLLVPLTKDLRRDSHPVDYRLIPPKETALAEPYAPDVQAIHDARCAYDDSLRTATKEAFLFRNPDNVYALVGELSDEGLDPIYTARLMEILPQTLCNGPDVANFLRSTEAKDLPLAVQLLDQLRIKDLQEVTYYTLQDYLIGVLQLGAHYQDTPLFRDYVLNPRAGNEIPLPYKAQLNDLLIANGMQVPGDNPQTVAAVRKALDALVIDTVHNPRHFPMAPYAAAQLGIVDPDSWSILGVALFRTAGIPARIDPVSGRFQAWLNNAWTLIQPTSSATETTPSETTPSAPLQATLRITYKPGPKEKMPAYDTQFTIQRWESNAGQGVPGYRTLGFAYESGGVEGTQVLNVSHTLEAGYYRIVTGVRLADGTVLAHVQPFTLEPGASLTLPLVFSPSQNELVSLAKMDVEWPFVAQDGTSSTILKAMGRRFFALALLDATKEPSQHFIRECAKLGTSYTIPTLYLFPNERTLQFFFHQEYDLPGNIMYGYDANGTIRKGLENALGESSLQTRMPLVIIADSFGSIYYQSIGYRIGIPEAVMQLKLP